MVKNYNASVDRPIRYSSNNNKSLIALAIALGCFAILFPKIFYPMIQGPSISANSKSRSVNSFHPSFRMPLKKANQIKKEETPYLSTNQFSGGEQIRSFPNLMDKRNKVNQESEFMSLLPVYTAIVVSLFVYAVIKILSKKDGGLNIEDVNLDEKIYPNLKMDTEYRKFLLQEKYDQKGRSLETLKKKRLNSMIANENNEITRLKLKLKNTEQQLQRLVEQFQSFNKGFIGLNEAYKNLETVCSCAYCNKNIDKKQHNSHKSDNQPHQNAQHENFIQYLINQTNIQEANKVNKQFNEKIIGHSNEQISDYEEFEQKNSENDDYGESENNYKQINKDFLNKFVNKKENELNNQSISHDTTDQFYELCSCSNTIESNSLKDLNSLDKSIDHEFNDQNLYSNQNNFINDEIGYIVEPDYYSTSKKNYLDNYPDEPNSKEKLIYIDVIDHKNEQNYLDKIKNFDRMRSEDSNSFLAEIDLKTKEVLNLFEEEQAKSLNQEMTELEKELELEFDYHEYELENKVQYRFEEPNEERLDYHKLRKILESKEYFKKEDDFKDLILSIENGRPQKVELTEEIRNQIANEMKNYLDNQKASQTTENNQINKLNKEQAINQGINEDVNQDANEDINQISNQYSYQKTSHTNDNLSLNDNKINQIDKKFKKFNKKDKKKLKDSIENSINYESSTFQNLQKPSEQLEEEVLASDEYYTKPQIDLTKELEKIGIQKSTIRKRKKSRKNKKQR